MFVAPSALTLSPQKWGEANTPTASTMTYQGAGCADHLCQQRECSECVDDRFKPLLEFEFLEALDSNMITKLHKLGWSPEAGSPAKFYDEHGDSLLHAAARTGDVQVMEKVLEMGAEVNACCQGDCCCSPLMVACRWCHYDCVCLLLEHKADVHQGNCCGEDALDKVLHQAMGIDHHAEQVLALMNEQHILVEPLM